jgi:hypothetical protein
VLGGSFTCPASGGGPTQFQLAAFALRLPFLSFRTRRVRNTHAAALEILPHPRNRLPPLPRHRSREPSALPEEVHGSPNTRVIKFRYM